MGGYIKAEQPRKRGSKFKFYIDVTTVQRQESSPKKNAKSFFYQSPKSFRGNSQYEEFKNDLHDTYRSFGTYVSEDIPKEHSDSDIDEYVKKHTNYMTAEADLDFDPNRQLGLLTTY